MSIKLLEVTPQAIHLEKKWRKLCAGFLRFYCIAIQCFVQKSSKMAKNAIFWHTIIATFFPNEYPTYNQLIILWTSAGAVIRKKI